MTLIASQTSLPHVILTQKIFKHNTQLLQIGLEHVMELRRRIMKAPTSLVEDEEGSGFNSCTMTETMAVIKDALIKLEIPDESVELKRMD